MKSMLDKPGFYRLFTDMVGARRARAIFVEKYIRPKKGDKVLDIACGIGDILEQLPSIQYHGFDMNQAYINAAIGRFGNRGSFSCGKITRDALKEPSAFDIVLASAVLHHLDDDVALELFELSHSSLKTGGRLITFDGCHVDRQPLMERLIFSMDRGKHVRTEENYKSLASKLFSDVKINIHHDLLRIPYTHIVMECTKETREK